MYPLVSAIITTHNRLSLLPRAIESVLAQTYPNIECIVVSDASTDGTIEYCLAHKDIHFVDIPKEESKGANHARNEGVKVAKGEYVAFLDDDDYWLPTKIEKQVALIKEKKCDLVYCGAMIERILDGGEVEYYERLQLEEAQGDLSRYILQHIVVLTSQVLTQKKAVINAGLFDEKVRFWQEYELTIRMAQNGQFYFVNEPLIVYRFDTYDLDRLTNKYRPWLKSVLYIHNKHRKLYAKLSFKEWLLSKQLFWKEGVKRAAKAGKFFDSRMFWLLLKLSKIDKIIKKRICKNF